MRGFFADIERLTEQNNDFRRELYTGKHMQLVLMSIQPGEEIGEETHADSDQFFRIESGKGAVILDGKRTEVKEDDVIIVPAGALHNVMNTGETPLRLYTIYAAPQHPVGTVHATKADAERGEEPFDGTTTE